jgi:hypothetical protein
VYGKPISSATYWEKIEPPMEIIKKKKKQAEQKSIDV